MNERNIIPAAVVVVVLTLIGYVLCQTNRYTQYIDNDKKVELLSGIRPYFTNQWEYVYYSNLVETISNGKK